MAAAVVVVSAAWIVATPGPTVLNVGVLALAILVLIGFPLLGTRVYSDEQRLLREQFERVMAGALERSPQAREAQTRT